jgi:hypothetical protein
MKDVFYAVHGPPTGVKVGNVTLHGFKVFNQAGVQVGKSKILPLAGRKIVQDAHAVPSIEQCPYNVRTDESGTTGNQMTRHGRFLSSTIFFVSPLRTESLSGGRTPFLVRRGLYVTEKDLSRNPKHLLGSFGTVKDGLSG